jgi:hypothetical protein
MAKSKLVVTTATTTALNRETNKKYGVPCQKLIKHDGMPTKQASTFMIGHVIADMQLPPEYWTANVNVLGLCQTTATPHGITANLVNEKDGKYSVVKAMPYSESSHHHVFIKNKKWAKSYENAVKACAAAFRTEFGAAVVEHLNKTVKDKKRKASLPRIQKAVAAWEAQGK